ncbi:MAG TPA: Rieske 2Fe-2S domain-containing protein [Burkholderiaceae bacterium]|jgi:nitrite reductase/ring-hydroxylating ferredoxin subunit|nr:Rieske 2Fe-2S domain-containing protein [Burkholderiaceae bacterium]
MAEPAPTEFPPVRLCASGDLAEKGLAFVFDVLQWREPMRAFVLRFEGRVVGYLNRCVHVPSEMDWQPGEFLDSRQEFILCATHGAAYEPASGRCVAGPCGRGRLTMLRVEERDGDVYWYPSRDTRPVFDGALPSTDERTP